MDDSKERVLTLLIFHLSGFDCAFPLDAIREVVPMARLSSPPGLAAVLAGFLDLRGTAIPIVRLDRLFELPEQQASLYTPLIVMRGIAGPIGILVDSVRGIVAVAAGDLLDISAGHPFLGCATATIQVDGDLIHLLSPDALIDANEGRVLADYTALAQTRLLHFPASAAAEEPI